MVHAKVAVVVPNFDGAAVLPGCLRALAAQTLAPLEVVVVDDASTDGSADAVARVLPSARVVRLPVNRGFAVAANTGVRATSAPAVAVLNSDARPAPDWLELLAGLEQREAFSWGGVLVDPDGRVQSAADCWSPDGHTLKWLRGQPVSALPAEPYEVLAPPGAAPVFDRDRFLELGGYDERYGMYLEDVDLALRAHARGWCSWVVPAARVEHDLAASSSPARVVRWVARNELRCHVLNSPSLAPRAWARTWRRDLGRARAAGVLGAHLRGRAAGVAELPALLRERRTRPRGSAPLGLPPYA